MKYRKIFLNIFSFINFLIQIIKKRMKKEHVIRNVRLYAEKLINKYLVLKEKFLLQEY
jgi:hypothetical protein